MSDSDRVLGRIRRLFSIVRLIEWLIRCSAEWSFILFSSRLGAIPNGNGKIKERKEYSHLTESRTLRMFEIKKSNFTRSKTKMNQRNRLR